MACGEVGTLRGHLRSRPARPGHPGKRRGDILPLSLRSPGMYGQFFFHGRYLAFGDKGPSLEGRGMNFSLKISSEALRISCLNSGTSYLGVTPNPHSGSFLVPLTQPLTSELVSFSKHASIPWQERA